MIVYNCHNCENDFRKQEKEILKHIEDLMKTIQKMKDYLEDMITELKGDRQKK